MRYGNRFLLAPKIFELITRSGYLKGAACSTVPEKATVTAEFVECSLVSILSSIFTFSGVSTLALNAQTKVGYCLSMQMIATNRYTTNLVSGRRG